MRKLIFMLGFLLLNFLCINAFAQSLPGEPSTNDAPTVVQAVVAEPIVELKTELTIYSLIAGVYALYWLKQRV